MAKQNGGKPQIDENFMKEIISQSVPVKRGNKPDNAPLEAQAGTVQAEKPTPHECESGMGGYWEAYFHKV